MAQTDDERLETTVETEPELNQPDEAEALDEDPIIDEAETSTARSEPVSAEPEHIAPERPIVVNQAGLGGIIAGGVIAAGIGALAALTFLPEGWRRGETAVLAERLDALENRPAMDQSALDAALSPLRARIEALESLDPAELLDPVENRLSALEPQVSDLATQLGAVAASPGAIDPSSLSAAIAPLSNRLDVIEGGLSAAARSAVDAALAESRAEIDAHASDLSQREISVEEAQARIAIRAALTDLEAAAASGEPAASAVATLAAHGDMPSALSAFDDGLPTLIALQDSFAPAARAALAAAPAPQGDVSVSDRLMGFLRSQTGARSLAPREGDDTDAVLSRAEADLRAGQLANALTTLQDLPQGPANAMADWVAQAQTRLQGLDALQAATEQFAQNEG